MKPNQAHVSALRQLGMIHITGLSLQFYLEHPRNGMPVSASRDDWGKYGQNNGVLVAILETGEVFLSMYTKEILDEIKKICPNGGGADVPCSNGETLHGWHLLCRSADPFWYGNGERFDFSPDPEQAEYELNRFS